MWPTRPPQGGAYEAASTGSSRRIGGSYRNMMKTIAMSRRVIVPLARRAVARAMIQISGRRAESRRYPRRPASEMPGLMSRRRLPVLAGAVEDEWDRSRGRGTSRGCSKPVRS